MNEQATIDEGLIKPKSNSKLKRIQRNRTAFWIVVCFFMLISLFGNTISGRVNYIALVLSISPFPFLIGIGIKRIRSWTFLGFIYCICITALFVFSLSMMLYLQSQNDSLTDMVLPTSIGMGLFLLLFIWGIAAHANYKKQ